jgi:16S rRNA (adenine1518-N6/adenine1519-N6)-dimethyltransferase
MRSVRKRPGARLGQHFLTGQWAARKLTDAVDVQEGETILEIGPGKGALTKELLATGARVVAVEKDPTLVAGLRETFKNEIALGKLELIEKDVRNFKPESWNLKAGSYVLAANIPYYITGEIIRQFLTGETQPRTVALLIQKEVAERIIARDGKESILSLSVKAYGTPKIVTKVSRGNFSPTPSVDSAILAVTNISRDFFTGISEEMFFKAVRAGFASKRKFLANNLGIVFDKKTAEHALAVCGINPKVRAEDVPLEKWRDIVRSLS